jgi:DNA-binding protein HU-beta
LDGAVAAGSQNGRKAQKSWSFPQKSQKSAGRPIDGHIRLAADSLGFSHSHYRRGPKVNKNDLVAAVSDNAGLSKADATRAVDGVFDAITAALKKGGDVRIVGFGTFSVAKRKATTGRNPRTGETINIAASKQPKFKAGKGLKDAVN